MTTTSSSATRDTAASPAAVAGELALERRFPGLSGRLRRIPLTTLPTPVERLAALGRAAGVGELWIKRDDRSARLYGGNKPRKLEFLVGDAVHRGRRSLVTFGGLGSHHALATAIAARSVGLRAQLVLIPQPVTEHVRRQLLLDHAYGAELHYASTVPRAALVAARVLARETLSGRAPGVIPAGGTSALGAVGYVNAALELAEQVRSGVVPEPFAIFVALGTGGTAAGLLLGLELAGLRSRVVAVLVTDILPPTASRLRHLARGCWRALRALDAGVPPVVLPAERLTVAAEHLGRGYGSATAEAELARRRLADCEGIELETTYTAKCLAALLAAAGQPPYRGRVLLFWNTFSSIDPAAGVPALPEPRALPPDFQRFFAAAPAAPSITSP